MLDQSARLMQVMLPLLLMLLPLAAGAPALPTAARAKCGVADLRNGATLDPSATENKGGSVKYIKSIVVAGANKKLACAQACCDEADCDLGIYELVQGPATAGDKSVASNNCFLLSCQPFNQCVFSNTSDMNALAIVNRELIKLDEDNSTQQQPTVTSSAPPVQKSPTTSSSSSGAGVPPSSQGRAGGEPGLMSGLGGGFMPSGRATGGLVAALVFGCTFTLVVAALTCRVLCEAWSRRHYSKLRYLDNGGSGF